MEEDILNYSPTVMFRGTPCSSVQLTKEVFITTMSAINHPAYESSLRGGGDMQLVDRSKTGQPENKKIGK